MRRRPWESVVLYGTLFLISLFFVLPVLAMISMSLKGGTTDLTDTGLIPRDPSLDNYRTLFENASSAPVVNWLINIHADVRDRHGADRRRRFALGLRLRPDGLPGPASAVRLLITTLSCPA